MHFTLVTLGLAAATLIASSNALESSVSSNKGLFDGIYSELGHPSGVKGGAFSYVTSGISGQYPSGDTPGTDDGAVKQTGRGTRDAGDAALDSTAGLAERIIGDDTIFSAITGITDHPDTPGTDDGAVKQTGRGARDIIDGALDSTAGLAGRILDDDASKNPSKRLFTKRNHGLKYDRAHIRRSIRSSLPQRNQDRVVYKRRSRIDGTKKVELTRRFWKDETEAEYSEEEETDIK